MSDSVRDLLVRGIAAAKENEKQQARFYLEWALRLDPSNDQTVEANFWLSEISEDPKEKREYLEEVLANQPTHYRARRALAILDGRLDPQEIIDPNELPEKPAGESIPAQAQRFVCPNCGGRMRYAPDGKSLVCDYCQAKSYFSPDEDPLEDIQDQDFTIALATARGHRKPVATRSFECQACGAVYMLSPRNLSVTCPYCASIYVLKDTHTTELIPPLEIIPFAHSKQDIQKRVRAWVAGRDIPSRVSIDSPRGLYLPVWAFTISGIVPFEYRQENDDQPKTGEKFFSYRDVLIPASRKIPALFLDEANNYRLDELKPYDPTYLADWPAETYQITLSDASLKARWETLARARSVIQREISIPVRELNLNSMDLLIETFKLILLPVWICIGDTQGSTFKLIVNDQTGSIRSEKGDP
jgi:DNA-directed RNA polymerase subunit RPC12/RpoP